MGIGDDDNYGRRDVGAPRHAVRTRGIDIA